MKVNIDSGKHIITVEKKIRIETENIIVTISICDITGNLIINKLDGKNEGALKIFPRCSNEIEII